MTKEFYIPLTEIRIDRFLFLLLLFVLHPFMEDMAGLRLLMDAFVTFILISGLYAVSAKKERLHCCHGPGFAYGCRKLVRPFPGRSGFYTILGMLPLLQDAFFITMVVSIMLGIGFATVLTLIVVPVLNAISFPGSISKVEA